VEWHLGAPLHSYDGNGREGGQIMENWGQAELRQHCFDFVEAVNHPTLHHTSIIHAYEVFEHLHMLWNGIWVHPYTVMMVLGGAKFGKLGSGGDKTTLWCHC
jgi:hypothetical protein